MLDSFIFFIYLETENNIQYIPEPEWEKFFQLRDGACLSLSGRDDELFLFESADENCLSLFESTDEDCLSLFERVDEDCLSLFERVDEDNLSLFEKVKEGICFCDTWDWECDDNLMKII